MFKMKRHLNIYDKYILVYTPHKEVMFQVLLNCIFTGLKKHFIINFNLQPHRPIETLQLYFIILIYCNNANNLNMFRIMSMYILKFRQLRLQTKYVLKNCFYFPS
jgi:hypothetical protein